MEGLKNTSFFILYGIKDCLLGVLALRYFWSQPPIVQQRKRLSDIPTTLFGVLHQCIVFGGLFWAGLFVFNRFILSYCYSYLESYLEPDEKNALSWLPSFLGVVFGVTWTLPLFVISRVLNYSWYQQIADLTFENTGGKKRSAASISYEWGDQIESTTVQCLFMVQGYAMLVLPLPEPIQHLLFNLHLSLLYALYSFEYKWVQMGWGLRKRLAYINSKWPYFLGFGLPLAVVSSYVGTYIESICIFSTLFPIYVVSSTVTIDSRVDHYNLPIKFFGLASYISNFFFVYLCSRIRPRR